MLIMEVFAQDQLNKAFAWAVAEVKRQHTKDVNQEQPTARKRKAPSEPLPTDKTSKPRKPNSTKKKIKSNHTTTNQQKQNSTNKKKKQQNNKTKKKQQEKKNNIS